MKKLIPSILVALLFIPLAAQERPAQPAKQAQNERPANAPAADAAKPVPVDQEFLVAYTQLQALLTELNEIEAQARAIRTRASARNEQLRQWMVERKVPAGWTYNPAKQEFEPPAEKPKNQP